MSKPEPNVIEPRGVASARLQTPIQWPVAGLNVTDHLLDNNRLSIDMLSTGLLLRLPTGERAFVPMTNVKFLVYK